MEQRYSTERKRKALIRTRHLLAILVLMGGFFGGGLSPGQAATPVVLNDSLRSVSLGTRVEFLKDESRTLTISDIVHTNMLWQTSDKAILNFGLTSSAWWFRFTVNNVIGKGHNWYFETAAPLLDTVDLYLPDNDGFRVIKSGSNYPFAEREKVDRGFVFPMPRSPGITTYYVRVTSAYPLIFNPIIHSPSSYLERFYKTYPIYWLYYGAIIIMAVYNLILFFLAREKNMFYLVILLTLAMLFQATVDGFTFQYLWPDSVRWMGIAPAFLLTLFTAVLAIFIREFNDFKKLMGDQFDRRWVSCIIIPNMIWAVICLLTGKGLIITYVTGGIVACSSALVVAGGIFCVLKGKTTNTVRFTFISFTPLVLGAAIAGLVSAGVLPANMLTASALKIGGSFFVAMLSVGLADKMLALKQELLATNTNISLMLQSISQDADTGIDNTGKGKDKEIGRILQTRFEKFLNSFKSLAHDVRDSADTLNASAFGLFDLSGKMATQTNDMSHRSDSVAAAAEQMNANMTTIAGTMEQTANNVNLIASSTEQMTSTVHEIIAHTESARATTAEAVTESAQVSKQVDELGRAAEKIGYITEAITAISKKTNLLALNATIEAARGGDSGHGFAVVARDIKVLASQTAEATQVINQQIVENREITADAVTEIKQIIDIISRVNEIVSTIAASIEQQSASTREIARNVSQISQGVTETNQSVAQCSSASGSVARDVVTLNTSFRQMDNNSRQLKDNAAELSRIADDLAVLIRQIRI